MTRVYGINRTLPEAGSSAGLHATRSSSSHDWLVDHLSRITHHSSITYGHITCVRNLLLEARKVVHIDFKVIIYQGPLMVDIWRNTIQAYGKILSLHMAGKWGYDCYYFYGQCSEYLHWPRTIYAFVTRSLTKRQREHMLMPTNWASASKTSLAGLTSRLSRWAQTKITWRSDYLGTLFWYIP